MDELVAQLRTKEIEWAAMDEFTRRGEAGIVLQKQLGELRVQCRAMYDTQRLAGLQNERVACEKNPVNCKCDAVGNVACEGKWYARLWNVVLSQLQLNPRWNVERLVDAVCEANNVNATMRNMLHTNAAYLVRN